MRGRRKPYHLDVATEYGGQPWHGDQQPYAGRPARQGRSRAGIAAVTLLVLGVVGLGASLVGVASQLLPRQFTAQQQRQITDWETGKRWRVLPAGTIFPASVRYAPPAPLSDGSALTLTASRIGIARQASCQAATDAPVAAVLARNGCLAVLRASYVDGTGSYVVTVGVVALPGAAQASAAGRELPAASAPGKVRPGVHTVRFSGTPAAGFGNSRRQISGSVTAGSYLILYTIGYADGRPQVPITADSYAYAEMTGAGGGVAQAVGSIVGSPVPPPHCPGTPGC